MKAKSKDYWCPRCGRMVRQEAAWRRHVDDRKCKIRDDDRDDRHSKSDG